MISTVLALLDNALLTLLAVGGAAGVVAAVVLRLAGYLPAVVAAILVPILIAVSAGSFGFLRGQDSERVRLEIARLEGVIIEQARQRAAAEKVASAARERAAERAAEAETLREIVGDYETALAAGDASACPDDDAYRRRMRSIDVRRPAAVDPAKP